MVKQGRQGAVWPRRADDPPVALRTQVMPDTITDLETDLEPRVRRVVSRWSHDPTGLVQILREVQEACDWIPPEAIDRLQSLLGVPRTKIEGVAGFYSFFYTRPRGKYRVLFSDNITDRMLGSLPLFEHMLRRLRLRRGEVSPDGAVSVASEIGQGTTFRISLPAVTSLPPMLIT